MKKTSMCWAALLPFVYAVPALASEEGGNKTLPQLDVSLYPSILFWMVASFLVLFAFVGLVGIPGVRKTIAKRRDVLDVDLGAARKAGEEARAVVEAYEHGLHDSRYKAQKMVNDVLMKAEKDMAEYNERSHEEFVKRMVATQENIALAKQSAMKDTQKFVNDLVTEIVERVMQPGIEPKAVK